MTSSPAAKTATLADALAAIDALHALGPRVVLVTSLELDETPDDATDLIVSDASGRFRVRTPRLPIMVNGAGDVVAALFFAHYLRTGVAAEALSLAASSIFGVLSRTAEEGAAEMLLVAAQEELVKPSQVFRARSLVKDRAARDERHAGRRIERVAMRFAPRPWPFAVERRAEIDAYFAQLQRAQPALWNGRVLLMYRSYHQRRQSCAARFSKPILRASSRGAPSIFRIGRSRSAFR